MPGAQRPPARKHVSSRTMYHVGNSLWKPSSRTSILKPSGLSQRQKEADERHAQKIRGMSFFIYLCQWYLTHMHPEMNWEAREALREMECDLDSGIAHATTDMEVNEALIQHPLAKKELS